MTMCEELRRSINVYDSSFSFSIRTKTNQLCIMQTKIRTQKSSKDIKMLDTFLTHKNTKTI